MTTFGGKPFDDEQQGGLRRGPEVHGDPRVALRATCKNETITYGGSLPKGQGIDALFYAQQLASCQMGRWILPEPEEAEVRLRHRAVSRPRTARPIAPVNVPVAAMGVNAKAKDPGRRAVVDHPVRERRGRSEGSTLRRRQRGAVDPRRRRRRDRGQPAGARRLLQRGGQGRLRHPAGHRAARPTVAANINAEIDKVIKSGGDAQDVRRPRSAPSSTRARSWPPRRGRLPPRTPQRSRWSWCESLRR